MSDFELGLLIGGVVGILISAIVEIICIKTGVSSIDTWMEEDK
jgi:hypothetical protein